jgi:hypothetical protein
VRRFSLPFAALIRSALSHDGFSVEDALRVRRPDFDERETCSRLGNFAQAADPNPGREMTQGDPGAPEKTLFDVFSEHRRALSRSRKALAFLSETGKAGTAPVY